MRRLCWICFPLLRSPPHHLCCCCCCVLTYAQFSSNWTRNVLRAAKPKPTPKTTRRRRWSWSFSHSYMLAIAIASSTENANFRWHAIVWLRLMTKVAHITGCHVPEIVSGRQRQKERRGERERGRESETERALNFFWRNLHELMLGRLKRSSSSSSSW